MIKNLLFISTAAMAFILANGVYAAGPNGANAQAQIQVQTQVVNQGTETNIQMMTEERTQSGDAVNPIAPQGAAPIQAKIQQNLPEDTADNQVKLQPRAVDQGAGVQNQANGNGAMQPANTVRPGTSTAVQAQQQLRDGSGTSTDDRGEQSSATAQQRRSQVANAVQVMLQLSDKNGGIGQQIRTIAQSQTQNQEKLETSLAKVQNRGAVAKFLFGPNYGEINNAEKTLEQNREQIRQLNQIKDQLANQADQQQLAEQISLLEKNNLQISESLADAQQGVSLFGWLNRLFAK